jgi:hypothetical protein
MQLHSPADIGLYAELGAGIGYYFFSIDTITHKHTQKPSGTVTTLTDDSGNSKLISLLSISPYFLVGYRF